MTAIYCRQSVDKRDSISIETQTAFCVRQLSDGEEYEVYADRGYSGSNVNRPDLSRLMRAAENGSVSRVVVYRLDRISRSLPDFAKMCETFRKNGITFNSATEKFDTSTPMGMAMLNIVMVFAQLERETIRTRIRDNYYERGRKGLYLGGKPPFGYDKIKAEIDGITSCALAENPAESAVVRFIYEKYLEDGASLCSVARALNSSDSPFDIGRNVSAAFAARILRNPVYARADADVYGYLKAKGAVFHNELSEFDGTRGCTVYGDRKSADGVHARLNICEGIIDPSDWLKVQEKLSRNRAVKNSGKGTNTWLSGLVKCGCCGRALAVVNGQRGGKRYVTCGGRKDGFCRGRERTLTFGEIEAAVEKSLLAYIRDFDFAEKTVPRRGARELAAVKLRLAEIARETDVIVERMSQSGETMIAYLNERIEQLDRQKNELLSELRAPESGGGKAVNAVGFSGIWEKLPLADKKEAARIFISRISVTDSEITVEYKV